VRHPPPESAPRARREPGCTAGWYPSRRSGRGDSGASEAVPAGLPANPLGMTKGGGLKWPSSLALTTHVLQQTGVLEGAASGHLGSAAESGSAPHAGVPGVREVQP
jgi:hypothetical protein